VLLRVEEVMDGALRDVTAAIMRMILDRDAGGRLTRFG
jgi:hypothetical protein